MCVGAVGVAVVRAGAVSAGEVSGRTKEEENKEISSSLKVIFSLSTKEDKEEKSAFLEEEISFPFTVTVMMKEKETDISSALTSIVFLQRQGRPSRCGGEHLRPDNKAACRGVARSTHEPTKRLSAVAW